MLIIAENGVWNTDGSIICSQRDYTDFLEMSGKWFETKKDNKTCLLITSFNYSILRLVQYFTSPFGGF